MAATFAFAALLFGFSSGVELKAEFSSGVQLKAEDKDTFDTWMTAHSRTYQKGSDEYQHRLRLFTERVEKAQKHNAKPGQLWVAGPGPLSDMSKDELQQKKGWFGSASATRGHGSPKRLRSGMFLNQETLPNDFNWSHLQALQNAPDQGECGSCWAVAASLVLDAHAEIYHSRQTSFSPQEIVNCVANSRHCGGTGGCQGATVELAMAYAMRTGLHAEEEIPYTGRDSSCKSPALVQSFAHDLQDDLSDDLQVAGVRKAAPNAPGLSLYGMQAWEKLPENKYQPLLQAVYQHGPVAVSVGADGWDMYNSGIFDRCNKNAIIDHAVTLMGYGQDESLGQKYWTIMNSWGGSFGEEGKIRLLRLDEEEAHCGVDSQPDVGTGCDGGPAEVKVCGRCGILYDTVVPHFKSL